MSNCAISSQFRHEQAKPGLYGLELDNPRLYIEGFMTRL